MTENKTPLSEYATICGVLIPMDMNEKYNLFLRIHVLFLCDIKFKALRIS